jgi:S-formylglutathione hydrolase FrmB
MPCRPRRRVIGPAELLALMMTVLMAGCAPAAVATRASGDLPDAAVVAEERAGPHLVDLTIQSPALGGTAEVRLLTPDGWEHRGRDDRWPVLYLLHGAGDDHATWTTDSDVEELPALRDVLVVMPDARIGYYTNWWNQGAGGPPRWEAFHLEELLGILERDYGASERRVAAGLSMGGFGAVSYAARRPGTFLAAASYSGPVHPLHPSFVADFPVDDPEALALWGHPVAQREVWEAHDPFFLAERLKGMPVFLASGDGAPGPLDAPGEPADPVETMLNQTNLALADRLRAAGAAVTTDFYGPGTHSPRYWERELHRSLPMLLCALGSCDGPPPDDTTER